METTSATVLCPLGAVYIHQEIVYEHTIGSPSTPADALWDTCTSGRTPYCGKGDGFNISTSWLHRDKLERDCRYISFNFNALCQRVVELCPGSASIATYDKKEGGFNRVFVFTTDNAKRVIAKLPFKLAGPPRLTTNSEVATIKYLQFNTSIPIPGIIDWSDDASNAVGSEYIIMEHARGVQLHERWPAMAGDQQIKCIDAIYRKVKEIMDMDFPAYGSLYFHGTALGSAPQLPLNERVCMGPHCGARYWGGDAGDRRYYHNTKPNHGPWSDLTAYCDGLIDTGISRIPFTDPIQKRPKYHGSPQSHLQLLQSCRAVIKKMSEDIRIRNVAAPTLLHPDLHKRNIFVSEDDPSVITDIIDWQSSSVEPAFWYADETPDFGKSDNEACAKAFDLCTQYLVPKLSQPRSMDEALFRPFRYCYRTWKDGAMALRHELIETSQGWENLGFTGSCPFPRPSAEELAAYRQEYQRFEVAQNLRYGLAELFDTASDGWVPEGAWEVTQAAHRKTYEGMLQAVLANTEPDLIETEEDLQEIWPFDL